VIPRVCGGWVWGSGAGDWDLACPSILVFILPLGKLMLGAFSLNRAMYDDPT